ncbi:MAG: DUF1573 domain-containing protein [Planctomycetes bacterium]|nr:DUF1573 domain-containing protein [Planctomycetota bacterium]
MGSDASKAVAIFHKSAFFDRRAVVAAWKSMSQIALLFLGCMAIIGSGVTAYMAVDSQTESLDGLSAVQPLYDLGKVHRSATVSADMEFVNRGRHPIGIVDVVASCACTAVTTHTRELPSWKTASVSVDWNVGNSPGVSETTIAVAYFDTATNEVGTAYTKLRAEVGSDLVFVPHTIAVDRENPSSGTVTFREKTLGQARLVSARSNHPACEVQLDVDRWQVKVDFDPARYDEAAEIFIIVRANTQKQEHFSIPIQVRD